MDLENSPWFAVRVKSRCEKQVNFSLTNKGYDCFLPLYTCARRRCDRVKEIEFPLFPGYLFCRFDPSKRLPILTTPGVVRILGIGKVPAPVDEAEIAAVQVILNSGFPARRWPFLEIGQRVHVKEGPLSGLEGILLDFKNHYRLVVSVTLLQRSVAVEMFNISVGVIEPARLSPLTAVFSAAKSRTGFRLPENLLRSNEPAA